MGGRIEQGSVEDVVRKTDIVDLIGGYTQLRRSGGDQYMGRCPFHDERTPSFSVSRAKGVYHCFGCGAGGDAIRFVREKLGLDFIEAVELLADRARVELRYEQTRPGERPARRVNKTRLFELTDAAAVYYTRVLAEAPQAAHAREYLAERGIAPATIEAFRLGYSPDAGSALAAKARARFSAQELQDARLVGKQGGDFFRGRVMVPIVDRAGRVLGFGGRKLREEQYGGKYVNSATGPLFDKRHVLFVPPKIADAAKNAGEVVVVEGYMDVIAMWQAGFPNAVAAMGTSLTDEQIVELKRLAPRAVFAFDDDAAGQDATLRALAKARQQQLDVRVVTLTDGDPADVLAAPDGTDRMRALLSGADSLLHYRVHALLDAADLASGPGRNAAYEQALRLFAQVPRSPERSEQIARVADRLELDAALANRLELARSAPVATPHREGGVLNAPAPARKRFVTATERVERLALAATWALTEHCAFDAAASTLTAEHFTFAPHERLWQAIVAADNNPVDIFAIRSDSEVVELVGELSALVQRDHLDEVDAATDVLAELTVRLELKRLERAIAKLKEALASADDDEELFARLRQLESERRSVDPRLADQGAPMKE